MQIGCQSAANRPLSNFFDRQLSVFLIEYISIEIYLNHQQRGSVTEVGLKNEYLGYLCWREID